MIWNFVCDIDNNYTYVQNTLEVYSNLNDQMLEKCKRVSEWVSEWMSDAL